MAADSGWEFIDNQRKIVELQGINCSDEFVYYFSELLDKCIILRKKECNLTIFDVSEAPLSL